MYDRELIFIKKKGQAGNESSVLQNPHMQGQSQHHHWVRMAKHFKQNHLHYMWLPAMFAQSTRPSRSQKAASTN